jgi:hypothetical protein
MRKPPPARHQRHAVSKQDQELPISRPHPEQMRCAFRDDLFIEAYVLE